VAAFIGVAALVALGTWQLERLEWKQDLIAEMAARQRAPAVPLPQVRSARDAAALEYRKVRLEGRFLHDREMYLGSRTYRGQVGYHVVTPMILIDGRRVLVDRGWVPPARKAPATRRDGLVAGVVVVEGLVRRGGWRGSAMFRPDRQPAPDVWLWPDLPAMIAHAGLGEDAVREIYIEAGPAPVPGGFPIGGQTRLTLTNNHLQYALTWYALAVALIVIYVLHQRRGGTGDAQSDAREEDAT